MFKTPCLEGDHVTQGLRAWGRSKAERAMGWALKDVRWDWCLGRDGRTRPGQAGPAGPGRNVFLLLGTLEGFKQPDTKVSWTSRSPLSCRNGDDALLCLVSPGLDAELGEGVGSVLELGPALHYPRCLSPKCISSTCYFGRLVDKPGSLSTFDGDMTLF